MPSSAFWAYGSTLQLGDGATPEVFTSIAEVLELTPPQMSRDEIDVTSHASADGYREFIGGLRDGGDVSVTCNWLPTNTTQDSTTGVLSTFNDNENHNWKIILPNTLATVAFTGFVMDFSPDTPLEEQGKVEFTIKVSGKPTVS